MATSQEVPVNTVKVFDMVKDWNSPIRIIMDERFYVVDGVKGTSERVIEVILKGNKTLGNDDFQVRNKGAMAALICGGEAYIVMADEEREKGTAGID